MELSSEISHSEMANLFLFYIEKTTKIPTEFVKCVEIDGEIMILINTGGNADTFFDFLRGFHSGFLQNP